MAMFLAGCGGPLLNDLLPCCSEDTAARKGLAHCGASQGTLVAPASDLVLSLVWG
uniref:Alternative protein FGR n=1 Tax=Homo sapiens TaxID=9606 RepID=L8E733_HUMAN|nr:alternative protein FGR [Homo sapiens]